MHGVVAVVTVYVVDPAEPTALKIRDQQWQTELHFHWLTASVFAHSPH